MPRPPMPDAREKLVSTATRLFYENGVHAVGMQRIISEAGTGKSVLYAHFATKDALVAAYLERVRALRESSARRAVSAAGDDPGDRLVALVTEVAELVRAPRFRGCAFRNYLAEFPGAGAGEEAPAGVARAVLAASRATVSELVGRLGVDDREGLTEQLWLIIDGLFLQAAYRDRLDGRLDAAADAAVRLAARLVGAAPGPPASLDPGR